ncbi:MAG TPA: hypothetical protein VF257_16430 [Solirubrobacteraceae bacterium]
MRSASLVLLTVALLVCVASSASAQLPVNPPPGPVYDGDKINWALSEGVGWVFSDNRGLCGGPVTYYWRVSIPGEGALDPTRTFERTDVGAIAPFTVNYTFHMPPGPAAGAFSISWSITASCYFQTLGNDVAVYGENGYMGLYEWNTDNRVRPGSAPIAPPSTSGKACQSKAGNRAPTVDLGAASTLPLGTPLRPAPSVRVSGTTCQKVKYRWSVVKEPSHPWPGVAVIGKPNVLRTTIRFSEAGAYRLRLQASDGRRTGSDTLRVAVKEPSYDWAPLVTNAQNAFGDALTRRLYSRGYYNQVLNIVCAAAKDGRPACGPMRPYYARASGARSRWARDWIYDVFRSFLSSPTNVVDLASAPAERQRYCRKIEASVGRPLGPFARRTCLANSTAEDFGALAAGMAHFYDHLGPGFDNTIPDRLRQSLRRAGLRRASGAVGQRVACASTTWIRTQHESLFSYAVTPGFAEVAKAFNLGNLAAFMAGNGAVGLAAAKLREDRLRGALAGLGARPCR